MSPRELAVIALLVGLLAGLAAGLLGPGECTGSIRAGCMVSDQRVLP
jgi:hypothetical protein